MQTDNLNQKILSRFSKLLTEMQQYVKSLHAANYAYVNTKLLAKAIIDYFEDIEKLKLFEGMDRINESKIYAYEAYWLLRRNPIQVVSQELSA